MFSAKKGIHKTHHERKEERKMSRKKALSLLLAVSMVFSLNTVAFAEEATVEATDDAAVEEVVEVEDSVETESQVSGDSVSADAQSVNKYYVSYNGTSTTFNGKADMSVKYHPASYYTGKNIKAADIDLTVSVDGYIVNAKGIKISGSKKNTSTGNTFKITSIDSNYKNIKYAHDTKFSDTDKVSANTHVYDSRSSEEAGARAAKAALKAVKKDFNKYLKKSSDNSFTFNIVARHIDDYVTYKSLKSLKVSGNSYAFNTYDSDLDNTAVVKINSNGKIQGVYVLAKGTERTNGTYTVRKVKLKKNTDYKISNSVITFEGTNINYSTSYDLTKLGASAGQST